MVEPGLICYDIESWLVLLELSPEDDGEPISWRQYKVFLQKTLILIVGVPQLFVETLHAHIVYNGTASKYSY